MNQLPWMINSDEQIDLKKQFANDHPVNHVFGEVAPGAGCDFGGGCALE